MSAPGDIIGFSFPDGRPVYRSRLLTAEEQTCGCGCQDIERDPAGPLVFYDEPEQWQPPEFLTSPGVSSAWFLLDGEYLPVAIMTMGDGEGNVMRRDL